jgi:hypothetical protein
MRHDRVHQKVLDEVRAKLAPSDRVLEVARARRRAVLDAAMAFPEARRKYNSGSIAHGTATTIWTPTAGS